MQRCKMAPRRRFERPTCRLGGGCSIQLSYRGRVCEKIGPYYNSQWLSRQSWGHAQRGTWRRSDLRI